MERGRLLRQCHYAGIFSFFLQYAGAAIGKERSAPGVSPLPGLQFGSAEPVFMPFLPNAA